MEEICCCCSTLHISSACGDCSTGIFSPHSGKSSDELFENKEATYIKTYYSVCSCNCDFFINKLLEGIGKT
jgi:hypothetical protein